MASCVRALADQSLTIGPSRLRPVQRPVNLVAVGVDDEVEGALGPDGLIVGADLPAHHDLVVPQA